jgi:large subunit ribosomal protein L32
MAAPKQKHTKSRRNKRRSHHALDKQVLSICPKCGADVLPHRVCANCGGYRGREVIDVLSKLDKKERKKKEKELAEQEKGKTEEKGLSMEELSKK